MPPIACWIALSCPTSLPPNDWLGLWALQFTPRVAPLEEAWVLDVTPTLRLWGGLDRLLQRLQTRWAAVHGLQAPPLTMAVGPSALAALARGRVAPEGAGATDAPWHADLPQADLQAIDLSRLPLGTLTALQPMLPVLHRLGLRTWGQLERLPRQGLVRRWGQGLLFTLDQAWGRAPLPLTWLQAPAAFSLALELPHAVTTAAALATPANQLLGALQGWLVQRHLGVQAVRWHWTHDPRRDGPTQGEQVVRLAQPAQHLAHLQRLTREHLARQVWPAPILRLGLDTLQLAPCTPGTADALSPAATAIGFTQSWPELLEHLRARLGDDAVRQWQVQDTHLTEAAQHPTNPDAPGPGVSDEADQTAGRPPTPVPLSPTWLAPQPLPLTVRGHRPIYQGALELLVGPHRVELTRWPGAPRAQNVPQTVHASPEPDAEATVRDHFLARSPGAGLVWVYRQPHPDGAEPAWFLLGWMA